MSTLRSKENMKAQFYFCGYAYRPHENVRKTGLFENASNPEEFENSGFALYNVHGK